MEDLFGHNRKPLMPKTASLEDHMYKGIPSDSEDYRGIKDMNFGLEEFALGLEQGYLKSNSSRMNLFGSMVPKFDAYAMEGIDSQWRRLNTIGLDDLQALKGLDGDMYAAAGLSVNGDIARVTPQTFYMLRDAVIAIQRLSDGVINDILEAVSEVCSTEFPIDKALETFTKQAAVLEEICDSVLVNHQGRGDEVIFRDDTKGQLTMLQTDFEMCVDIMVEYLPRVNHLDNDILNIACLVQNISAHCIRINMNYSQFKPEGRPALGKMTRFAADIEKIPGLISSLLVTLQTCSDLMNSVLTEARKKTA